MKLLIQIIFLLLVAVVSIELAGRLRAPPGEEILPLAGEDIISPLRGGETPPPPTPPADSPAPSLSPRVKTPTRPPPRPPSPPPLVPLPTIEIILPPPAPSPAPVRTDQEFYARTADAVIQIFCTTEKEIFSASGVIVNERGLVMTNAHVASIAKNSGLANCQARHGNPAVPFAGLEVVFIADTNTKIPNTEVPQRDIAFLRIVNASAPFHTTEFDPVDAATGETLWTLGYPSEFLEGIIAVGHSNLVFSALRVAGLADIDGDGSNAEGYVFKGGIVLQQGSSGTALFGRRGRVVGLIFATTKGATTAEREGVAISTSYIERILKLETGQGLAGFISSH